MEARGFGDREVGAIRDGRRVDLAGGERADADRRRADGDELRGVARDAVSGEHVLGQVVVEAAIVGDGEGAARETGDVGDLGLGGDQVGRAERGGNYAAERDVVLGPEAEHRVDADVGEVDMAGVQRGHRLALLQQPQRPVVNAAVAVVGLQIALSRKAEGARLNISDDGYLVG